MPTWRHSLAPALPQIGGAFGVVAARALARGREHRVFLEQLGGHGVLAVAVLVRRAARELGLDGGRVLLERPLELGLELAQRRRMGREETLADAHVARRRQHTRRRFHLIHMQSVALVIRYKNKLSV